MMIKKVKIAAVIISPLLMFACFFDTYYEQTPLISRAEFGTITADGTDITAAVEAGEYFHITGAGAVEYQFTANDSAGVEFVKWALHDGYDSAVLPDGESIVINDENGSCIYPYINMPHFEEIYADSLNDELLAVCVDNDGSSSFKIISFSSGLPTLISDVDVELDEIQGFADGIIYYLSDGTLRALSVSDLQDSSVIIIESMKADTSADFDYWLYLSSGYILFRNIYSDDTADYTVYNISTKTSDSYTDSIQTGREAPVLSEDGLVILSAEYSGSVSNISSIDLDTDTKLSLVGPDAEGRLRLTDFRKDLGEFSYTRSVLEYDSGTNSLAASTEYYLYTGGSSTQLDTRAQYSPAAGWMQVDSRDNQTVFLSINTADMSTSEIFSVDIPQNDIEEILPGVFTGTDIMLKDLDTYAQNGGFNKIMIYSRADNKLQDYFAVSVFE